MRRTLNPLLLLATLTLFLGTALTQPPKPPKPPTPGPVPAPSEKPDRHRHPPHERPKDPGDESINLPLGKDPALEPPLQPIPAGPFGDRLDLTREWQFRTGSGPVESPAQSAVPAYAKPGFPDRDWTRVDTTRPLVLNGYLNVNEAWYRRHILLPPGSHSLALAIADFGGSYRVYANGREIGGHGKMSGRGDYLIAPSSTYPIPDDLLTASPTQPAPAQPGPAQPGPAQPVELVIAIHAFVGTVDRATFTLNDGINKSSTVYLGPAGVLYRDQQFYYDHGLSESPVVLTLWTLLFLLALALASLIRNVHAYPLLAIYAGGHLISLLVMDYSRFHFLGRDHWFALFAVIPMMASELAALEFARNVAGTPRRKLFTTVEIIYILCYGSLLPANLGIISFAIYAILIRIGYFVILAATFLLIATGVRRRKRDAYILAGFGGLYLLYLFAWWALQYIVFSYAFLTRIADGFEAHLLPSPIGDLAIVAAFLSVVISRTLRLVRERASIATEIEAARTMQQLLLARSTDPTPGFYVETAYLPAGEVGGDFFLVITLHATGDSEAGLFCIVGDVSGKGLRAAMRVSMILGVLRREPSRDPAVVLHSLNEALLAQPGGPDRSDSGFTTACCVRICASGHFTCANAGHIAPYLASAGVIGPIRTAETGSSYELLTPPALPLGLAPGQTYDTVEGHLAPGERLVLLSDGVPEARTPKGELYGFDRLPQLTLKPAAEIARTAQAFGQEDDITVLTIVALIPTTNQPPPPVAAPPPPSPFRPPPPPPRLHQRIKGSKLE